jgi:hypothetical protein
MGRGLRSDRLLHLEHRYGPAVAKYNADATSDADADADADANTQAHPDADRRAHGRADAGADTRSHGGPDTAADADADVFGAAAATAADLALAHCRESPKGPSFGAREPRLTMRTRGRLVV